VSDTIRPTTRTRIATGLAMLCQLLGEVPSIGLTQRSDAEGAPEQEAVADEVLFVAGPVIVFRRGGWASRFATLPLLAVGLDQWPASAQPTHRGVHGRLRSVGGDLPSEALTELA
jgi:hypothetical protein